MARGDVELHLDYDGIGQILRSSEMAGAIGEIANGIAADVDGVVSTYTTDRAAASVTVSGRNALDRELIEGRLADAARARGLDVNRR
jgi:hypothetical protein